MFAWVHVSKQERHGICTNQWAQIWISTQVALMCSRTEWFPKNTRRS